MLLSRRELLKAGVAGAGATQGDQDTSAGGAQWIDTRVSDRPQAYYALGQAGRWVTYPERLTAAGISWKVVLDCGRPGPWWPVPLVADVLATLGAVGWMVRRRRRRQVEPEPDAESEA